MPNHKYTQGDASGRVTTAHYVDEVNITNELRQIVEDLAIIVGQIKLGDGQYPADGTVGILATNLKKCNYEAEANPTKNDDKTKGYSKGSMWIYDQIGYLCVDATENNAIWKEMTYYEVVS